MPIHPTAIVDPGAELDPSVTVGPLAVIEAGVVVGPETTIGAHSVLSGPTVIGARNLIGPFCTVGAAPQDLKYGGEPTRLTIGNDNQIREYASIHRGTVDGLGETRIGDHNFLMAYSHVAHDCELGSHVVMANAATLGGHVQVADRAILGGLVAVHQFCRVGRFAFVGGLSGVSLDVPPFVRVSGIRGGMRVSSINVVGLRRAGFPEETVTSLRQAHRIIFRRPELLLEAALEEALATAPGCAEVAELVAFFRSSRRGVIRRNGGDD
ncbi:MAG: acyl-ACP--UDP-N-acetylglucosamine O-acyltransferase [Thermodesulfobacteriota bacterium]